MYDRSKADVARGERKVQKIEFKEKHLLPLDTSDLKISAPPSPNQFQYTKPLSATSTTDKLFDAPPRRRSSSFNEQQQAPQQTAPNWRLGNIKETSPPPTPRNQSPPQFENGNGVQNGNRRRDGHNVGVPTRLLLNGIKRAGYLPVRETLRNDIAEKGSWDKFQR